MRSRHVRVGVELAATSGYHRRTARPPAAVPPMAASPPFGRVVRFGAFEADLRLGELRKGGRRIGLQEQPFRVLAVLLERPGDLVTREELRQRLWPADTFVDFEHGLNAAV